MADGKSLEEGLTVWEWNSGMVVAGRSGCRHSLLVQSLLRIWRSVLFSTFMAIVCRAPGTVLLAMVTQIHSAARALFN